ncbi:MGS207 protein [Trichoderma harzianum]|uniref:MGS207 protein n=1 Tax=Trichoderma harzianum TaxID=5544 RepID=A0A0F9XKC3_TRIHA|nr:MGS207 protein [Trichoderma harzianum]
MSSPGKLRFPESLFTSRHGEATVVLCRLIEDNHNQNRLLYKKVLHNHVQHGLIAAYCLGSSGAQLRELFSEEIKELEPREESKREKITTELGLDELLGHKENELDFMKYFEQQRSNSGVHVQEALQYWILEREKGFLPAFIGGYAHPLIMFADAVELGSSMLAFDALALTAIDWNPLTTLVTMSLPLPETCSNSLLEILDKIRNDSSFEHVVPSPGIQHIAEILHNGPATTAIIKYLSIGNEYILRPEFNLQATREMVEVAIYLLMCTHVPGAPAFDFYLNHNLTFVNCLRILLPVFEDADAKKTLLRIYWLLTILAFVTQGRPVVNTELIQSRDARPSTAEWEKIKNNALNPMGISNPKRIFDAHFLKAVHIMHTFGLVMGEDMEPLILAAAQKFVGEFNNWTGFGAS